MENQDKKDYARSVKILFSRFRMQKVTRIKLHVKQRLSIKCRERLQNLNTITSFHVVLAISLSMEKLLNYSKPVYKYLKNYQNMLKIPRPQSNLPNEITLSVFLLN